MSQDTIQSHKILSLKETEQRTHLSRSTIYRLMSQGEFPKNVHITVNRVAWLEVDINNWLNDRIDRSRSKYEGQNVKA